MDKKGFDVLSKPKSLHVFRKVSCKNGIKLWSKDGNN